MDENRILVVGGDKTTEVMDLTDEERFEVSAGPALAKERYQCAAVALDGRVLVAGGADAEGPLKTTELLDVATMTFSRGPGVAAR